MMKRIFALILCFIMMVNLIPMSTFAVSDNDISEEATEKTEKTPCLTCEQYDCTSDHTNWCYDCKKDDCGTTHVWCETCQKNDCGVVSHGKELPRIPEESVSPAAYVSEDVTTEFKIEDLVKFNKETVYVWSDPSNYITQTPVTASGFPAEMKIVAQHAFSETTTLYKLEAADGSEWPADFLEYVWAEGKYLTKVEKISCDCGCENCIGEEGCVCRCGKCDFCEKEPENTCECCENCTGAEGCECFCGECDFCEKEEDPTVPSISDTVTDVNGNEQTVTVSGEALPEGAELTAVEVVADLDGGFAYDIKILDANGNEWQPSDGQEVTLSIPVSGVADGEYIELIHLLEKETAIQKAISEGNVWTEDWVADVFPAAAAAYQTLTGEENTFAFEVFKLEPKDGMVKVPVTSFSVYFWTGSSFTSTAAGVSDDIIFHDTVTSDRSTETFYVTPGQSIRCNRGGIIVSNREWRFGGITLTYDQNLSGADGPRIYFTVPSNATIGTQFWIECRIKRETGFLNYQWSDWNRVNFVVVNNWTVNFYQNYDSSDNTVCSSDTGVLSGGVGYVEPVVFPSAPTRTGYKFMGWAETRDGTTVNTSTWRPNQNNDSLFAIWKAQYKYSLTFNANAPTGTTVTSMPSNYSSSAWEDESSKSIPVNNPSCSGYIFKGWSESASAKTGTMYSSYTLTGTSAGTTSKTLYAVWTPITYSVNFNANGGGNPVTGSMPTLNMTYDVETTLPRCKYVNSGDGMVFLGWATSPTGGVEHTDGAKIKNLTTTNGATVTLYAKWKYGLDSKVYIGINNTYHNPKGTYTAGGVTINSYHTYPNEPAKMNGDFDRVTDKTGKWTYHIESDVPLNGKANAYINGNIFNSPDYEMTYVSGENTLGIADPTGSAVRSMLKFEEKDYNAMIEVWLNGMRNTLIGYDDASFNWGTAKAEDFVMVPYVIKFQDYSNWYIDMVVVPKALYTLAYDGNIENGYTASFIDVAFPPSSQYTDGSMVNVVNTPIGYKGNNMKVTKVVDGYTYEATFQYWYDNKGNTYGGNTGKNTIKLTEDTILYAKWKYPDAEFGNLNITKTVLDKDAYEDPSAEQTFTFKFTTNAADSYNYTIYDQHANVKGSGSIADNETFNLQNGWRIRITDLPKDAIYSVTENAVNYYNNVSGPVSGTINAGATTYATVTNEYQRNADYTVKHFLQNTDKNSYSEQADSAEKRHGIIGTDTQATAHNYNGYTSKPFTQKEIQADGKTVIEIYYDLIAEATIVDLTITAKTADSEQSFIFTVSGKRSDGVTFESIDVVLCSENDFRVTIKDLPVGEYTVTEKDEWSWREDTVSSQTADLRTESKTLSFNFDEVDDLHWLSGYSYKRKKGDS